MEISIQKKEKFSELIYHLSYFTLRFFFLFPKSVSIFYFYQALLFLSTLLCANC